MARPQIRAHAKATNATPLLDQDSPQGTIPPLCPLLLSSPSPISPSLPSPLSASHPPRTAYPNPHPCFLLFFHLQEAEGVSAEKAKELYRDMYLGREFEEMCAQVGT